jgi:hypothetical protein
MKPTAASRKQTGARRSANVTQEKLLDLPFESAKQLKAAQEEIRLQVWRRMEEARIINQMIEKDQYRFWLDEFNKGLICAYEEVESPRLVRVYSDREGIHIAINRGVAGKAPASETVLGILIQSLSESFASTYFRAKGIMAPFGEQGHKRTDASRLGGEGRE